MLVLLKGIFSADTSPPPWGSRGETLMNPVCKIPRGGGTAQLNTKDLEKKISQNEVNTIEQQSACNTSK